MDAIVSLPLECEVSLTLILKSNAAHSNSANISLSSVYMQNTLQDRAWDSKIKIDL